MVIVVVNIGAGLGSLRGSLRGADIGAVHRFEDALSEVDLPNLQKSDVWPEEEDNEHTDSDDDSMEVADSDENDDAMEDDYNEGETDTVEHLLRISSIVDTNDDGILSAQEMKAFADGLRSKKRWENTRTTLAAVDTNGDGQLTHAEIANRVSTSARSKGELRFNVADWNGDGLLNETEFHAFAHPDAHFTVLELETEHQFGYFDKDR